MNTEDYCKEVHRKLVGADPSEEQCVLYKNSNKVNAFATKEPTPAQVEATLLLAVMKSDFGKNDVVVYIPHDRYVAGMVKSLRDLGKKILDRVSKEDQKKLLPVLESYFDRLKIGVAGNWRVRPDQWVACYFHERSPVPPWFIERLLVTTEKE